MRIAMYTDSFHPFTSGVTTAVTNLANMLAAAGHQIFIQAPRPKTPIDLSFLHPNIQVQFVRAVDVLIYPDFRLGTNIPLFLTDIKAFQPDIIHVHTPASVGLEGTLIAKRLKIPVVQTFHTYYDLKMFRVNNETLGQMFDQGGWRALAMLSRLYDATLAPTEEVFQDLQEQSFPGDIFRTPNVLAEDAFAPLPKSRKKPKKFIYVARHSSEKQIDTLLHAFALAYQRDPSFELHLIGNGPAQKDLFSLSLKLGIGPAVRWYGKIPHAQLLRDRFFQRGDIFVTASCMETFGYTTLEALAQGLPVVAFNVKANAEIIGDAGWLIPQSETEEVRIRTLARALWDSSQEDLHPLRSKAQKQAQKFTAQTLLPLYEEVYESVIHKKNK